MFSFRRSPKVSFSRTPADITNNEFGKDYGIPAGKFRPAADLTSDVNPGELTFEEGTSRLGIYYLQSRPLLTNVDIRHSRWNGSPFGCV